jgi:LCP family protein required for cell wall assembly
VPLTDHARETTLRMTRVMYPHDALPDEAYEKVVRKLEGDAAADDDIRATIEDGVAELDRPTPFNDLDADGRLDLLLLGADTGPGRFSTRTDTVILLSVDLETCRAALFGFPRNMTNVPLPGESAGAYPGGRFPEFLFALWRRAMEQPESFPGDDSVRGWRAVSGAIQELAGVPIDGMVAVNLNGFVRLVDALGGLWIDVPRRLRDPTYPLEDGSGNVAIDIRRGCQKLGGRLALAYARSRHQDDDYQRMRRQQQVLTAFRRQFDPLALLPRINDLFDIAEGNLHMFIDLNTAGDLAALASGVNPDRIRRVTFSPPRYTSPLDDATIARIRTTVRTVFDGQEPQPTPSPSRSPGRTCPP